MSTDAKKEFLKILEEKFGRVKKIPGSQSLFEISRGKRFYYRYSRIHSRNQAFYGLRKEDLDQLAGLDSYICFMSDKGTEPVFITYSDFEEILLSTKPASDGQYKVQLFLKEDAFELYIAQSGRYSVESYVGWSRLLQRLGEHQGFEVPDLGHSQIQTLIGSIGFMKGYDVWIPTTDRSKLD